jgi:ATP synthase F1 gamma subunit
MSRVTEQKQRIEDIESARYITGALRDISAIELKNLRKKFERNDIFYTELRQLFQLVWRIASANKVDVSTLQGKKSLYIAYTTNRHFYGSLNNDVIRKFIEGTDAQSNCLVVGDTGKQLWSSRAQKRREVQYLSFKDDTPNIEEITNLMNKVKEYKHVYVFYPGFTSIFHQDVEMVDITFRPPKQKLSEKEIEELPQYLFEPDLSEMVVFFNNQVRYALFERILLETQISRVAARLVKMDTADQNAKDLVKIELRKLQRVRTSFSSRRMLETIVGYIQWHDRQTQLIGQ